MGNDTYQHYIPASYLARFSNRRLSPIRKSVLAVGSKERQRVFSWSAEYIGGEKGFYEISNPFESYNIDAIWYGYEANLTTALDQLIDGSITALTWAVVVVPFIAGLMVRGHDFNQRFKSRLDPLGFMVDRDQVNLGRFMEIQRIIAPLLSSRWLILKINGEDTPLITNDTGYVPFYHPNLGIGVAIPLALDYLLVLLPSRLRYLAKFVKGIWWPIIHYAYLTPDYHLLINQMIDKYSIRYIIGNERSTVEKFLTPSIDQLPEMEEMGFINGRQMRIHEFMWHRLTAALVKAERGLAVTDFPVDIPELENIDWRPPISLGTNFPSYSFPSDIYRENDLLVANLYEGILI